MFKRSFFLQVAGPTIFVSVFLLGLGVTAAVLLYREHATSLEALDEDVESRRVAQQLQTAVSELATGLGEGRMDRLPGLHERVRKRLADAWDLTDSEMEVQLVRDVDNSLEKYSTRWGASLQGGGARARQAARAAAEFLQKDTLPAC